MTAHAIPSDPVADRLERLYAPAVLDVMEERGMWNQAVPPGLVPVRAGQRVAGPAHPYSYEASDIRDRDLIISEILRVYTEAPRGSVLVAAAGTQPPFAAHFGELSATTCAANGLRGAIIDGGLRDGDLVAASGFPVWHRYRTPVDVVGRYRIRDVGAPVRLGEVVVHPGDYVVADGDGAVVVPAGVVHEVVEAAEACCNEETAIRERLLRREDALQVFEQTGRF